MTFISSSRSTSQILTYARTCILYATSQYKVIPQSHVITVSITCIRLCHLHVWHIHMYTYAAK